MTSLLGTRPTTVADGRRRLEHEVVAGRYDAIDLLPVRVDHACSGSSVCGRVRWGCWPRATSPTSRTPEYAPHR